MKQLLTLIALLTTLNVLAQDTANHVANSSLNAEINSISTYPNPASQFLMMDFQSRSNSKIKITIYTMTGHELLSQVSPGVQGKQRMKFDISHFNGGYYLISLQGEQVNETRKFLVKG